MTDERVPKILIGSSSEGLMFAEAIKAALEPQIEVQLWNDGFFTPGEYTVESLDERSRLFDGALIVGTSEDRVISRGVESEAIRDNLLFEFGMFVAIFGRRRAILALEGLGVTKTPSDLFGLTCVGFTHTDPIADGIAEAIVEIRRVINGFSLDVVEQKVALSLEKVLQAFIHELAVALGSPSRIGFHVWVVDRRVEPPKLVRVARSRTAPKAMLRKDFVEGEGVAGECWRTASAVHVDFSEEPYRSINEKAWREFGPGARKGMSFELLEQSRERYRVVGATPVISQLSTGAKLLGCISYNVGPNVDAFDVVSDAVEVESILDRVSEVVRIILEAH